MNRKMKHVFITLVVSVVLVLVNGLPPNYMDMSDARFALEDDVTKVSVVYNETTKKLTILEGENKNYTARAWFKNSSNKTGWSLLKVVTNGSYDDVLQAEAAGLAEGYLTAMFIDMSYNNTLGGYCKDETEYCTKLKKYMSDNDAWIEKQINDMRGSSYWHQVNLIYTQVKGMYEGYKLKNTTTGNLTEWDFKLLQANGDLEDLEVALGKKETKRILGSGSCSALVKLFSGNKDLGISHVTWDDYNSMLRIYKNYNFSFHEEPGKGSGKVASQIQSFSSAPGFVFSGDDFYILDSGMVTQETTIGNSNEDLWKYVTPESVLEWVRTMVANRLAYTGNDWVSIFERYNSGTYNNQWMVLDYKLFDAGKPLKPDTLWILEQLPGTVHMADMTLLLEKQGYWSSYNLPYFPYVYNTSGTLEAKSKFGSWFDYHENPRAQIFARDHSKVVDMQTFVKLMRYNDFKNDPLSKCNCTPNAYSAENAISARSDLNVKNGTYPFAALGHRRHGATDCKATNSRLAKGLSQFIVAGPTWDQQEPFQWSKTEWKQPAGHPDIFQFEPSILDWKAQSWIDIN